jgi:hypothetical protein
MLSIQRIFIYSKYFNMSGRFLQLR